MIPADIYKALCDLCPGIEITSYKKWDLNSITAIPKVGPMIVFTYISNNDWSIRTIKYERRNGK